MGGRLREGPDSAEASSEASAAHFARAWTADALPAGRLRRDEPGSARTDSA